jgi:hypothetical protein
VRRLFLSLTVIAILGILMGCSHKLPGDWVVQLGPRISGVTAPTAANNAGTNFTFAVQTTGPTVVAWSWDFGGGATPDTSTVAAPNVVLVNPSTTTDATYNGSVTVTDADNRSDTFDFTYVVGRTLNVSPTFVGLPASISGNFSFSVDDVDLDPVAITLAVTAGAGVTVDPTSIAATSANYGPFNITVTSGNVADTDVTITITLNDGVNPDVVGTVSGTIPGIVLPTNSIVAVPSATSVNAGDTIVLTVYAGNLDFALGYLNSVDIAYSANVAPDTATWNLGAAGGAFDFKDGFWADVPDTLLPPPTALFFMTAGHVQVNVSLLGSPPTGSAVGASGALFNVAFTANTAGSATFDFVPAGTNYFDPAGVTHDFTTLQNATVTVN